MSDATEEQIRELHAMCIEDGAEKLEGVRKWIKHQSIYPFMGIDLDGDIVAWCEDAVLSQFNNNQIKLGDVEAHLKG